MSGLVVTSYGAYLPANRVSRAQMGAAFGSAGLRGHRTVASYDEDSITLSVEAAGRVVSDRDLDPETLTFVSSTPVYRERSNCSIVHAALDLSADVAAHDSVGTAQTAVGALTLAREGSRPAVLVAADVRPGRQGGEFEWYGCDAAAALGLAAEGSAPAVATLRGAASLVLPVGDIWQAADQDAPRSWDGRFSSSVISSRAVEQGERLLVDHGDGSPVHFVVSANGRRVRAGLIGRGRRLGWEYVGQVADDLGYAGAADPLLVMTAAFEQLKPGQQLLVLTVADGVTAQLWQAGEAVGAGPAPTIATQLAQRCPVDYLTYLRWSGRTVEEPPRRPEPDLVSAPAAFRNRRWKYGLVGGDCALCSGRNLPPQRICMHCRKPTEMVPVSLRGIPGTVRSATIDHLAYAQGSKVLAAVVDLDGGGRLSSEVADAHGTLLSPGDRVVPTFRRLSSSGGVHNYFWKVRPVAGGVE